MQYSMFRCLELTETKRQEQIWKCLSVCKWGLGVNRAEENVWHWQNVVKKKKAKASAIEEWEKEEKAEVCGKGRKEDCGGIRCRVQLSGGATTLNKW